MRCYECGHINQSGTKVCIKCGTKISSVQKQSPKPDAGSANSGKHTIVGKASDAPAWDSKPSDHSPSKSQGSQKRKSVPECSACGYYPLRELPSKAKPCVNCGFTGDTQNNRESDSNRHSTPAGNSSSKTVKIGSVNLGKKPPRPKVVLHDENTGKSIQFEGDKIVLNRGSLDPDNPSISSKEHAILHLKEGKIEIEDRSSNQATFIQATGKREIAVNSLIIVGDKVYKVDIKN
ncbi:MAG: hypothetical protein JJU46_12735 [Balneolaceae bacterium]|nr:hypothetical protein [Balneolaceae bacterium]MCH8549536.1 hypothetical protein [Balneolaceae bacterium]